ncbi:MAG: Rha family transcriptional regulator [Gammaproteobacteria bacterium]|nr:Rha family transcriptional regulator [Gammaproteobacteria bacterium]
MSDANHIIDALGGTKAVADLFRIKPPSVSEWRKKGIPSARMDYIKLAYPNLFRPGNDVDRAA